MRKLILFSWLCLSFFVLSAGEKDRLAVMDVQDKDKIFTRTTQDKITAYIFDKFQEAGIYWMIPKVDRDTALDQAIEETKIESRRECVDEKCQLSLVAQLQANFLINAEIKNLFPGTCQISIKKFDVEKRAGVEAWRSKFDCTEKGVYKYIDEFNFGKQKKSELLPEDDFAEDDFDENSSISSNGWLTLLTVKGKSGFEVELDGNTIGRTPVNKLQVNDGIHTVQITDVCYEGIKKFKIKKGEERTINLNIKPRESAIKVKTKDRKGKETRADVIVDGKNLGKSPGTFIVPLCSRKLLLKDDVYNVQKQIDLFLEEKKIKNIEIALKTELANWSMVHAKLSWKEAEKYCDSLTEDGSSDWRLPTISELKVLAPGEGKAILCEVSDKCLSWDCYDKKKCLEHRRGAAELWSSSFLSGSKESVWLMDLMGNMFYDHKEYKHFVRCYRD